MFEPNKATITIQGKELEIVELSARQRQEIPKLSKKGIDIEAYCIKQCVPAFSTIDLDEILDFPASVFQELSEAVLKISGLGNDSVKESGKNS